jgi:hypothetical protein
LIVHYIARTYLAHVGYVNIVVRPIGGTPRILVADKSGRRMSQIIIHCKMAVHTSIKTNPINRDDIGLTELDDLSLESLRERAFREFGNEGERVLKLLQC